MKFEGSHDVPAPRQKVWDAFLDPEQLRQAIPGCEKLESVGNDGYRAVMKGGVGGVKGTFEGKVRLMDKNPPDSYRMAVEGSGGPGFVRGETVITLSDIFLFDYGMGMDEHGRYLGHLKPTGIRPKFLEKLSDEELKGKTSEFRQRVANGEALEDVLFEAYSGDFQLGDENRWIDLLGATQGHPLFSQSGYINIDNMVYRVMTITVPVIVENAWTQAP